MATENHSKLHITRLSPPEDIKLGVTCLHYNALCIGEEDYNAVTH